MSATTEVMPGQPHDDAGPVFREAWEAQAFGLTLLLHQRGVFSWAEWAATLAQEIKAAQHRGDPDLGDTYYRHWLHALERLVAAKGLSTTGDIERMTEDWLKSARETPHGQPVLLIGAVRATAVSKDGMEDVKIPAANLPDSRHRSIGCPVRASCPMLSSRHSIWRSGLHQSESRKCEGDVFDPGR